MMMVMEKKRVRERTMLCCVVDTSPLITGGCPEKSLPAGGICACAKWTWNMPRWITEGPSAPLAVPLHDNPREGKRRREAGWRMLGTRATTVLTNLPRPFSLNFLPSFFLSLSLSLPPPTLKRAVFNWRRGKKKQTYAARRGKKREITTETRGQGDVENIRSPTFICSGGCRSIKRRGKKIEAHSW